MAEFNPVKSRLMPSLLDRLTDDDPGNPKEAEARQVLKEVEWLKNIRRDLEWLFNAASLESALPEKAKLDAYDPRPDDPVKVNYLKESVLNFGILDISGQTASSIKTADPLIEKRLRLAILNFEPRILPATLKIDVRASDQFNHNALSFDIRGDLWMQPSPLPQHWKTDVDLETGAVNISEKNEKKG
jgi:type VI secretion system protein ImpF